MCRLLGEKSSVAPPNDSPLTEFGDSSDEDSIVEKITKKTSHVRRSLFSGGKSHMLIKFCNLHRLFFKYFKIGEESVGAPLKVKDKRVEKQSKGKWHVSPLKQTLFEEKSLSSDTYGIIFILILRIGFSRSAGLLIY